MKTFLIALCLFFLTMSFVVWNTWDLQKTYHEMLRLAEALPTEASDFRQDAETEALVQTLYHLWDRQFPRIALTGGYENYNRADEAMESLWIHYQNDNANDFTHARLLFWNSLHRMQKLEQIF